MHRLLIGTPKGLETDHRNRNKLDNRRKNLRIVDRSQNSLNTKIRNDNKSGYKGVFWRADRNKWYVYFRGKYLGYYETFRKAINVRKIAEQYGHS